MKSIQQIKIISFLLCIFCFMLVGCASINKPIEKKQYLFSLATQPIKSNFKKRNILLHQVTIAAPYNQNFFLYRVSTNQYLTDYYHSFLIPAPKQLDSILANYLSTTQNNNTISNNLDVQITELYADYRNRNNPKAVISLKFTLTTEKGNKTAVRLDKTFHTATPLNAKNTESLISAWNVGLQSAIDQGLLELNKIPYNKS